MSGATVIPTVGIDENGRVDAWGCHADLMRAIERRKTAEMMKGAIYPLAGLYAFLPAEQNNAHATGRIWLEPLAENEKPQTISAALKDVCGMLSGDVLYGGDVAELRGEIREVIGRLEAHGL